MARYMNVIEQAPSQETKVDVKKLEEKVESVPKLVKVGGGTLLLIGGFFMPGIIGKVMMGAGGLAAGLGISDMMHGAHAHEAKPSGTTAAAAK